MQISKSDYSRTPADETTLFSFLSQALVATDGMSSERNVNAVDENEAT